MPRAFLVVLDSVGCGGAPDAAEFGDAGANTLGHIAEACAAGQVETGRHGPLSMPTLARLGLAKSMAQAVTPPPGGTELWPEPNIAGAFWGVGQEKSRGKDTPSGHWEIAGVPVPWEWHYFPDAVPSFPPELTARVCELAGTDGILGNCHASGTEIIDELGKQHILSGWPICYTSADSVFQIAAHEKSFGLQRLLDLCAALAPDLHRMKVGRVIARPFVGTAKTGFTRSAHRHDYAMETPSPTLCEWVQAAGGTVHGIGKISDIFTGKGVDTTETGEDRDLIEHLVKRVHSAEDGSLTFANLVEFDSQYGHRRNLPGYARALEWFDTQVPRILAKMRDGDLLIITADHGNDPTFTGTDHTRERVPVIGLVKGGETIGDVGVRDYADIAASVAQHLGVENRGPGRSFL